MSAPPGHVSIAEAVRQLGIARQRVHQLIRMGLLAGTQADDKRWYVPQEAINERRALLQHQNSTQCITTREVADFFGVDVKTVRAWYHAKLLKGTMYGGRKGKLCFSTADVVSFVPPSLGWRRKPPTRTLRGRTFPPPPGWPAGPTTNQKGTNQSGNRKAEAGDEGAANPAP
jgi:hypothetical protein